MRAANATPQPIAASERRALAPQAGGEVRSTGSSSARHRARGRCTACIAACSLERLCACRCRDQLSVQEQGTRELERTREGPTFEQTGDGLCLADYRQQSAVTLLLGMAAEFRGVEDT